METSITQLRKLANAALGKREDFQRFVEAAHQRGIAILADAIYDHTSSLFAAPPVTSKTVRGTVLGTLAQRNARQARQHGIRHTTLFRLIGPVFRCQANEGL